MQKKIAISILMLAVLFGGYLIFELVRPPAELILQGGPKKNQNQPSSQKTLKERIRDAAMRSQNVKGVYVTAAVANDQGRPATNLRNSILEILSTTEINAVVIDVKETPGGQITDHLKPFVDELKSRGVWTIARMATFRDNSQVTAHPDYYVKRPDGGIWRDNKGNAWLDPMSEGTRAYMLSFAKNVADIGFDEIQYDYVRFPSDGDTRDIVYPAYQASSMPKYLAIKDYLSFIHDNLKAYKPELILSADLFGYVATETEDLGIGQRLIDVASNVDFISLMLYPSHFYAGFDVPADSLRNLAAASLPYRGASTTSLVSANPYAVVYHSLLVAHDALLGRVPHGTTTPNPAIVNENPAVKFRPWLQDFDLGVDTSRGIYYDAKAVRAQIDAAEHAGASGWLLWSPTNTYTEAALRPKS
ncbi:MAG: hypothetical protein HY220_00195 [Candidatus Sungbacteria bacterium]|uniref:DUF4015 domain-containing protein n=1 Tax=Candidatus Sungiibacteriota bacterium TaxID=2750080 RepID=A0A9D6QRM9_9BACT|nr:hypothetical protein [Candidatus Sungbacteria bacterium]